MRKITKNAILATLLGFLLISGTAYALKAEKNVKARFANIKLIVNGKTIQTAAEPFIYNGNVYAPVATVANMLGIQQLWDNNIPAVKFSNGAQQKQAVFAEVPPEIWLHDQVYLGKPKIPAKAKATDPKGGQYEVDSVYTLVDLSHPLQIKKIPVPADTIEGYTRVRSLPLSQKFSQYTANAGNTQFLMYNELKTGQSYHGWVTPFQYKNGAVLAMGGSPITETDQFSLDVMYSEQSRTISATLLDSNGNVAGFRMYKIYENGWGLNKISEMMMSKT